MCLLVAVALCGGQCITFSWGQEEQVPRGLGLPQAMPPQQGQWRRCSQGWSLTAAPSLLMKQET